MGCSWPSDKALVLKMPCGNGFDSHLASQCVWSGFYFLVCSGVGQWPHCHIDKKMVKILEIPYPDKKYCCLKFASII
jgi:hypothetical protein